MYSPCRPNVTPYRFVLYVQNVTLKQSLLLHSAYYVYRIGRPNVIIVCLLCRPNVTPYIFVLYVALQRPRSPWSACMNVTMVDYGIKRSRSNRTIFTLQAPMVWLIALYAVLAILRWMNVCNSTIRLFNSQLSTDLANDNIFLKQNVSSENFCCRCNYDIYVKCFCFKRCLQLFYSQNMSILNILILEDITRQLDTHIKMTSSKHRIPVPSQRPKGLSSVNSQLSHFGFAENFFNILQKNRKQRA